MKDLSGKDNNDFKLLYYLKATPFLYSKMSVFVKLFKIYFADGL